MCLLFLTQVYGKTASPHHTCKPTFMAEILPSSNHNSSRRLPPKHIRIDMTPIVDLGFLLIAFFIFTASITETKAMKLFMPADGAGTFIGQSTVLTLLLRANNRILLYEGDWESAVHRGKLVTTNYNVYSGAGSYIRTKQKALGARSKELMLLIKPTEGATYQNIVNALDEVKINDVKKYALVEPSAEEKASANNH